MPPLYILLVFAFAFLCSGLNYAVGIMQTHPKSDAEDHAWITFFICCVIGFTFPLVMMVGFDINMFKMK